MAAKLIALALCVAAAMGTDVPAAKYPAGVSPHACPNYPYCDNVALAVGAVAPYAAHAYAAYGNHGGALYPAGVDPHTCPNYPYCDNVALAAHGAHGWAGWHGWAGHAPAWAHWGVPGVYGSGAGAKYPAGVDPHTCPNYPYCHY
ncbi:cuticle protein 1-like [Ischnura elegans]|uniref:cuticle protein 1-like n=1 Tax=Ischnura elegans TaxID=197161 RepID=UPI001ED8AE8F|nr:cuticle protein 1-like [Ischnura elegans]